MTTSVQPSPAGPAAGPAAGVVPVTGRADAVWRRTWVRRAVALVALVVVGLFVADAPNLMTGYFLYLFTLGAVYALVALGMTVLLGWAGQVSLLPAAFMGIGAYGADWLHQTAHIPWAPAVLLTALGVGVVGTALAVPALRLRGFYLAIATLALAEAVVYSFTAFTSVTGGNEGQYVTTFTLFGLTQTWTIWYVSMAVLAVAVYLVNRVRRTSLGRLLVGVRDVEVAMGPLAISPAVLKLIAFAISAVLASIAGSLYAQLVTYIDPSQFDLPLLIELLVIVFLGGIDSVAGAIIGSAAVIALTEALGHVGSIEPIVFGGVLVVVILFLRRGLVSLPETVAEQRWARAALDFVTRGRTAAAANAGSQVAPGLRSAATGTGASEAVEVATGLPGSSGTAGREVEPSAVDGTHQ